MLPTVQLGDWRPPPRRWIAPDKAATKPRQFPHMKLPLSGRASARRWILGLATCGATLSASAATPKSIHLEERGHLNEVREGAGSVVVTVVREGSLTKAASVRVRTADRTATAGLDYGAVDQVVSFAPGVSSQQVTIPILADAIREGNERFRVLLSEASGGVLTDEDTRESIYINDAQDDPANDDFESPTALSGYKGSLKTTNKGASRQPGEPQHKAPRNRSVWYTYTAPGTGFAKFGSRNKKFTTLLSVYTGSSLDQLKRIRLKADDSNLPDDSNLGDDSDDSALVRIQAGTVYRIAVDDSNDDADDSNDPADSDDSDDGHGGGGKPFLLTWKTILPGKLEFSAATYSANETDGTASIKVTRSGGLDGVVRVHYATADATATDGADYTAASGDLVFAAGQKNATLTVPLLDDPLFEQPEKVLLQLSKPSGGARLGLLTKAKLLIQSEDPFAPAAGKYTALVSATPFSNRMTGILTATTTDLGMLTGRLQLGGVVYLLSGAFDSNYQLTITKPRRSGPPVVITLQLAADGSTLTGTVSIGTASASFAGDRNGFDATSSPAPQKGRYTVLIPGDTTMPGAAFPTGDGWGVTKVSGSGTGRIAGTLADGSKFSAGFALNAGGKAPLYASLYNLKGSFSGDFTFASDPGVSDAAGSLYWFKRANIANTPLYPAGFGITVPLLASAYQHVDGTRFLAALDPTKGKAVITFSQGTLPADLGQSLKVSPQNLVQFSPSPTVETVMTIKPASGIFSGTFKRTDKTREYHFSGVAFPVQDRGAGFFLGKTASGFVRLAPAP